MEDYLHLGRKLIWVHPDPLEGESLPRLQVAITRLSRGAPLFVSMLPAADAAELSRLCDAVAAENGHTWRWQRSAEVGQTGRKLGFWRRHRD